MPDNSRLTGEDARYTSCRSAVRILREYADELSMAVFTKTWAGRVARPAHLRRIEIQLDTVCHCIAELVVNSSMTDERLQSMDRVRAKAEAQVRA